MFLIHCAERPVTSALLLSLFPLPSPTVDLQQCPLLDIMLGAGERGMGMCTDVALYVLHVGARMLPKLEKGVLDKVGKCGCV